MAIGKAATRDLVDRILEQWRRERPDLDTSPMSVIARISRLSRILERRIALVLAEHGLNESQFGVLAALRRAGPPYCLSPTALYGSLLISSGAMTNRLDRLTVAGLVRRIPDPNDRRSTLVQLTPKGLRVIEEAVAAHTENEQQLLGPLRASERRALAEHLRTLLSEYEDESQLLARIDSFDPDDGAGRSRERDRRSTPDGRSTPGDGQPPRRDGSSTAPPTRRRSSRAEP
jgi:DNA-binding MarR family transcriptional regulator